MKKGICYIVCAGDNFGLNFTPGKDDYVIAVDAGYSYLEKSGIRSNALIGDFDSLTVLPDHSNIIVLNPVKDDTDTYSAIKFGIKEGYKDFHIYCGTGGRIAHTIANIQSLVYLAKQGLSGRIVGNGEIMTVIHNNEFTLDNIESGYVSIFTLGTKAVGVTLEGLKYQLNDYTMTNSYPIGVSNELIGKIAKIKVDDGTLLIIYDRQ